LGTCIGVRNYRYFIWFVLSLNLYGCYIVAFCIIGLIENTYLNDDHGEAIVKHLYSIIIIAFIFIVRNTTNT
jgi:hypothetical protein